MQAYGVAMSTNGRVAAESPRWAGVHHLALVTDDMDSTVRFYHGVLGAELVATIGNKAFRHYFFRLGDGQTIAFFEYRGQPVEHFAKPAGIPDMRASQFDHLSLGLADEGALEELRERLIAHGCEVTEVVDHDIMRSVYFSDPNGIALEASWWILDATAGSPDHSNARLFGDADPVPSVDEIAGEGLQSTAVTRLVDEPTPAAG